MLPSFVLSSDDSEVVAHCESSLTSLNPDDVAQAASASGRAVSMACLSSDPSSGPSVAVLSSHLSLFVASRVLPLSTTPSASASEVVGRVWDGCSTRVEALGSAVSISSWLEVAEEVVRRCDAAGLTDRTSRVARPVRRASCAAVGTAVLAVGVGLTSHAATLSSADYLRLAALLLDAKRLIKASKGVVKLGQERVATALATIATTRMPTALWTLLSTYKDETRLSPEEEAFVGETLGAGLEGALSVWLSAPKPSTVAVQLNTWLQLVEETMRRQRGGDDGEDGADEVDADGNAPLFVVDTIRRPDPELEEEEEEEEEEDSDDEDSEEEEEVYAGGGAGAGAGAGGGAGAGAGGRVMRSNKKRQDPASKPPTPSSSKAQKRTRTRH